MGDRDARIGLAVKAVLTGEWVLVPVEPTEGMIDACEDALADWRKSLSPDERMMRTIFRFGKRCVSAEEREKHAIRYRAMITAAPAPDTPGAPEQAGGE